MMTQIGEDEIGTREGIVTSIVPIDALQMTEVETRETVGIQVTEIITPERRTERVTQEATVGDLSIEIQKAEEVEIRMIVMVAKKASKAQKVKRIIIFFYCILLKQLSIFKTPLRVNKN